MSNQSKLSSVRINLSGKRLLTSWTLFTSAIQMLLVGKTHIQVRTKLPS